LRNLVDGFRSARSFVNCSSRIGRVFGLRDEVEAFGVRLRHRQHAVGHRGIGRRDAGRSGLEVMHWIFAAATVPQARGEEIFYEPMPEWITGMGGIALTP